MRAGVLAMSVAIVGALLAGCSSHQGSDGDCTIKVRYDHEVYRSVGVQSTPRPGRSLGDAAFGDCEGHRLRTSESGELFALPRTDSHDAVLLRTGRGDSVYVNTEMSIRGWPALVKAAYRPPGCQRSATFTGTLDVIDPEYRPDEGDYGVALPYPAWFTATHGRALGLGDRWSSVMLEARITRDTEPVPSPQFLKRALSGETPVTLTTTCRGDRFEVATIGFADGHP